MSTDKELVFSKQTNLRKRCCSKENLKEQALLFATIAAVLIGIAVGIALRELKCPGGSNLSNYSLENRLFSLFR